MEGFLSRYSRTVLLEGIDFEGQKKISNSKILILGAGGLSSTIISILAASGIGTIYIIEPDSLELSNLQRQFIYKEKDIGTSKALLAKQFIESLNSNVEVIIKTSPFQVQNIDAILDATDSFKSRLDSNKLAMQLGVPFFTGSAVNFTGHVYSFFPSMQTGCYSCLFGNDESYIEAKTCANSGVFPALPSVIGSIMAHNILFFLSYHQINLQEFFTKFILVDFLKQKYFKEVTFERDTQCTICQK